MITKHRIPKKIFDQADLIFPTALSFTRGRQRGYYIISSNKNRMTFRQNGKMSISVPKYTVIFVHKPRLSTTYWEVGQVVVEKEIPFNEHYICLDEGYHKHLSKFEPSFIIGTEK